MKIFYKIDFNTSEEQMAFTKAFITAVRQKFQHCNPHRIKLAFETSKGDHHSVGIDITDKNVKIPLEKMDDFVTIGIIAAAKCKRRLSAASSVSTSSPRSPRPASPQI